MGGIAITIPNANFYTEFGNTITDLVDVPVTKVAIISNDYYVGTKYAMAVQYTPLKTSNRGVRWSIVSGTEYCSIDEATGVITIFESANMSPVTIKAISLYDNEIYDTKEIQLLYKRAADNTMSTIGKLKNVSSAADAPYGTRKTLVKEVGSNDWSLSDAPPNIDLVHTEEQVNQMIEDGTIDENTLYFCEE